MKWNWYINFNTQLSNSNIYVCLKIISGIVFNMDNVCVAGHDSMAGKTSTQILGLY